MRLPGTLLVAGLFAVGAPAGAPAAAPAVTAKPAPPAPAAGAAPNTGSAAGAPGQPRLAPAGTVTPPVKAQPGKSPPANAPPANAAPANAPPAKTSPAKTLPKAAAGAPSAQTICATVEQAAARNQLPADFFARVIWQESRFNARAVSPKGAQGIAQFMPETADFRGLADPFDPIASLENAAGYLGDLRRQFGNLGLAAAGYNAGPGRVREWLAGKRGLPIETRNYVAVITGWTASEWASPAPPQLAETTIPQGLPCTRLANLVLAPPTEAGRIAAYVPRWGAQITANWSEVAAWATYRTLQKRFARLIGDREPIVLRGRLPGMGTVPRYMIRIADDNKAFLDTLCDKLMAAGGACAVLRNGRAVPMSPPQAGGSG